MNFTNPCQNERGAALVISLMFLTILAMLGTTAVVMTTTDMQIGANYKVHAQAFYDADAGVNYVIAKMEAGLKDGSFALPSTIGGTSSLTAFTAPTGFGFSYQAPGITMIAENRFSFTTMGADPNISSTTTIAASCMRMPAIKYAAFGDKKLDIKSSATLTSYDSSSLDPNVSNPLTAATHEADIGSNEWLLTGSGSSIDGSGVLGEHADGSSATDAIDDPDDFYGPTPLVVGRVDPDPLDVTSGGEYDPDTYEFSNDNDLAIGLVGDTIAGGTPSTLFGGNAGATANYYLTSITVNNGVALTIDTSSGRGAVRVFLTGPIDLKNGSSIVMNPASFDTTKFTIFSNSTDIISIKNSSTFIGLIYAPYSTNVDVMNSADFYGAVWGSNVELKNSGNIYYDTSLGDEFLTTDLVLTTWQDVRS